jgi:hypothetical protein
LNYWRVAAAVSCVWLLLSGPVGAYSNIAPIDVSVNGQKITFDDFRGLTNGILTAHISQVAKGVTEMPSFAPLVYYAGNHVVWISKSLHQDLGTFANVSPADQPGEDAVIAATSLAAMDVGTAGEPWDGLYARTPSTPAARIALGKSVVEAWKAASGQSEAYAIVQTEWLQTHIAVGMTRHDVYVMLESRGLIPYNPAYEGRVASEACLHDNVTGTWPQPNVPIPTPAAPCSKFVQPPIANPEAFLYIEGAFGIGCDTATEATISFSRDDRVSKVEINKNGGGCI